MRVEAVRRRDWRGAIAVAMAMLTLIAPSSLCAASTTDGPKPGVNLSGGEFNPSGSVRGVDYSYPTQADVLRAARAGFRVVRLPFLAKRILSGAIPRDGEPTDLEQVVDLVDTAARAGMAVVLDMHDYGFDANGDLIGQTPGATQTFADSWTTIAAAFRDRRNVIFGLMNEPHFQSPRVWRIAANQAIAAIRGAGARQGILVPTTDWSIASRWGVNGNAEEMAKIVDPANNVAIELHQYFDRDQSGRRESVREGIGSSALADFTAWARANGRRGFLGEFAWADGAAGEREGAALLAYMAANADVWAGWAYWGGGSQWGDYMFALVDSRGAERPQMRVLRRHMGRTVAIEASR